MTGGTIAFPQDAARLLTTLPPSPKDVAEHFLVTFAAVDRSGLAKHRDLRVRRSCVSDALQWKQRHNPFYCEIEISSEALLELPEDAVPSAFLNEAVPSPVPLNSSSGAAESTFASDDAAVRPLTAVLVDAVGADVPVGHAGTLLCSPASLLFRIWKLCVLLACCTPPSLQQLQLFRVSCETASSSSGVAEPVRLLIPRGDTPLDSFAASYWSYCHPHLFPFGLDADGISRRRSLDDAAWAWARSLLLRGDLAEPRWAEDLIFLASLYSVRLRRSLLRSIRVRVSSPCWTSIVQAMDSLKSIDFAEVASVLDDHASVFAALRSAHVSSIMKSTVRLLRLVESTVPTTNGARIDMGRRLVGLHHCFGAPIVFLTIIYTAFCQRQCHGRLVSCVGQ